MKRRISQWQYSWRVVQCGVVALLTHSIGMAQTDSIGAELKATEYYYKAMNERLADREAEAFALLRYSHTLAPESGEIAYALGQMYAGRDEAERALELYRQAYESDTTSLEYMSALVSVLAYREQRAEAVELLKRWLRHTPNDEEVQMMLGRLYYQMGEYAEAIKLYDRQQREQASSYIEFMRLAQVKAGLYEASNEPDKAVEEFRRVIKAYPNEREPRFRLILQLLSSDKGAEAHPLIGELERLGYDPERVLSMRTQAYLQQGDTLAVRTLLEEQMTHSEIGLETKLKLWYSLLMSQSKPDSVSTSYNYAFERLKELYPGEVEPVLTLSQVYRLQGRYREALDNALPLKKTAPEQSEVWNSLIGDAISLEDNKLATDLALEALAFVQDDWRYYYYASIGLYTQEKTQEAKDLIKRALSEVDGITAQGRSVLLGHLGDIYGQEKDMKTAIGYYGQALEANPDNAEVLNNYAWALVEAGQDLEHAESMAARAVKLNPSNANALDTYAWIFYRRGKYSLARIYQSKAIEVAGDEPTAVLYDHLGDIYEALGSTDEALHSWAQALQLYRDELRASVDDEPDGKSLERIKTLEDKLKQHRK